MEKKKIIEAKSSVKDQIKVVASKAIEMFRALEELHEENLLFFFDAYDTSKQFIQDKVIAWHLELCLSFLDEDDDLNEEADATITLHGGHF